MSEDLYPWNTRLSDLKTRLANYSWQNKYDRRQMPGGEKELLEQGVYKALQEFQYPHSLWIMQWANEARIGPGFVVD